jgi:hypothetical protein
VPVSSAFAGVWFIHDGAVGEAFSIPKNVAACLTPDIDEVAIDLPLELVCKFVNRFGH